MTGFMGGLELFHQGIISKIFGQLNSYVKQIYPHKTSLLKQKNECVVKFCIVKKYFFRVYPWQLIFIIRVFVVFQFHL